MPDWSLEKGSETVEFIQLMASYGLLAMIAAVPWGVYRLIKALRP